MSTDPFLDNHSYKGATEVLTDDTPLGVEYKTLDFLGFPRAKVGSDGSVWTLRRWTGLWEQKRLHKNNEGRYIVNFWNKDAKKVKSFLLNRLILMAFVGQCPEGMESCHNDGNPDNNVLNNLRWDTPLNNHADKKRHGTHRRGESVYNAKRTADEVRDIRRLYADGAHTQDELAAMYGMCQMGIWKIVNRKTWAHVD